MSTIKLLKFFFVCLLLVCGSTVFARGGGPPPALPDSTQIVKIVEQTAQALSLDDEQKVQKSDLYFTHFAEARALMGSAQGRQENNRKQMDALRQGFEEEVKALLDDEQKNEFEELVKNRRNKSGQTRQGRP